MPCLRGKPGLGFSRFRSRDVGGHCEALEGRGKVWEALRPEGAWGNCRIQHEPPNKQELGPKDQPSKDKPPMKELANHCNPYAQ